MIPRSLALLGGALLALPAAAQVAAPDKYKSGNVIIAFEGGVVGEALGNVLLSLAKGENLLFTAPHTVAKGDSVCAVMIARGFPPTCSAQLLQAIDLLNPKQSPSRRLAAGQTILLPDVWLRKYTTGRALSKALPAERNRAAAIKKSWSHLDAAVKQSSARAEQVDFQAYELILRSPDEVRQKKLMERVTPYRSANVRVTAIGFQALKAKAFSQDTARYQQECTRTPPVPPSKIDYRSYADVDGDLANLIRERPASARPVKVYLIDVKLEETPNLAGAVEGGGVAPASAPAWRCAWAGAGTNRQHATHLAGIIASRDNGFGFVGLSPSSTIVSYDFLKPSATSETGLDIPPERVPWLADAINENRGNEEPYLYLVASSFPDFDAGVLDARGQIKKEDRVSDDRPIENRISDLRPLFIVAAGQTNRPVALSPTTPMSPQNLGDLRNVLVVSACENCTRAAPRLMADANFGGLDGRYVHVAAPGGSPILGWVSGTGVGEAKGTSQAAAYAAGVAAEMIGRWPESYKEADYVKRRIQVTSWPMFKHPGNDDHLKIATGLVDPVLALVDPRQSWLKDASGWRAVRLKGFSEPKPTFMTPSNGEVIASYKAIARLVRVNSVDPAKWILYRAGGMGEVMRDGPVSADLALAAVTCGNERILLRDIQDLVIANGLLTENACAP